MAGREVECIAGRKLTIGRTYIAQSGVRAGQHGAYVVVRTDNGNAFVSSENLRVPDPGKYLGEYMDTSDIICPSCLESFSGFKENFVYPHHQLLCKGCHKKAIFTGRTNQGVNLPKGWSLHFRPEEHQAPGEEQFLEAIYEKPADKTNWLVYADWIEDNPSIAPAEDQRVADQIRLMVGHKKVSYSAKKLVFTPFVQIDEVDFYAPRGKYWETRVTGFPTDGLKFDTVRIVARKLSFKYPSFTYLLKGEEVLYPSLPRRLMTAIKTAFKAKVEKELPQEEQAQDAVQEH